MRLSHEVSDEKMQFFLVGCIVVAVCYAIFSRASTNDSGMRETSVDQCNRSVVLALGGVLWPVVWQVFVGAQVLDRAPFAALGLAWPMVLLFLDLLWIVNGTDSQNKQTLSYDGNAISSIAFAVGGLLVTSVGQQFARAASPILTSCVLLIVAVVIPTPGARNGTRLSAIVSAIQKVCLSYCVGMILTAVCINLQFGLSKLKHKQGNLLASAFDNVEAQVKK